MQLNLVQYKTGIVIVGQGDLAQGLTHVVGGHVAQLKLLFCQRVRIGFVGYKIGKKINNDKRLILIDRQDRCR